MSMRFSNRWSHLNSSCPIQAEETREGRFEGGGAVSRSAAFSNSILTAVLCTPIFAL